MPTRIMRHGLARVAALIAVAAFALPAAAQAAGPAAATITSCKDDHLTVAGKVAMTGSAARKVRGANLQIRFQALALFGLPRAGGWTDLGKKARASGQQDFTALPFDNWVGVMSWRFKKGSKTVASGLERSQPVKIGGKTGRANCTLAEGLKPVDTTPPSLFILPVDDNWHRAPAGVQLIAKDDFSGVKSLSYQVDDGAATPIQNGGTFTIAGEGAHTIDASATDVAGNVGTRTATVKVDAGPPTKPALSRPFSVTASTTPQFQWSASTDSGSGLRGYLLSIRRADGSVVGQQFLDANTTSATSPATLNDGETYTAVVTAGDNTADQQWTIDSDPLTFRVDTRPDVSSSVDNTVLAFEAKKGAIVVNFDRPVNPTSKSGVTLMRDSASGSTVAATGPDCSSPCNSISFTPDQQNGLGEGRYTLGVNVTSEEGVAMQKTFKFAVPDPNNEFSTKSTTSSCTLVPATQPVTVRTTTANEPALASFDYSIASGAARVRVLEGGTQLAARSLDPANSGIRQTLPFTLAAAGVHSLMLEYCDTSGTSQLTLTNIWVSRAP